MVPSRSSQGRVVRRPVCPLDSLDIGDFDAVVSRKRSICGLSYTVFGIGEMLSKWGALEVRGEVVATSDLILAAVAQATCLENLTAVAMAVSPSQTTSCRALRSTFPDIATLKLDSSPGLVNRPGYQSSCMLLILEICGECILMLGSVCCPPGTTTSSQNPIAPRDWYRKDESYVFQVAIDLDFVSSCLQMLSRASKVIQMSSLADGMAKASAFIRVPVAVATHYDGTGGKRGGSGFGSSVGGQTDVDRDAETSTVCVWVVLTESAVSGERDVALLF
ncbi:unnamed protein product [Phytophthora lilii]|uniref:Unnamed protein product n=1 Tax=Phytophthora lilii TaxID=2077276 RepID=A0A9W6XCJ0_9STRA|nr:unnamed protein product [Phytophthora lilii]